MPSSAVADIQNQLHEFVNNWDLVDSSAHKIIGDYLRDRSKRLLHRLAKSGVLWERRIAIMSTAAYINDGEFGETLKIAEVLLHDDQDLIHKAVGWMLREIGERKELMSFKSDPVTDRNDIYEAYIAFAHTPGFLNVSSQKPKCAYLCREYCGRYYWIPPEAAPSFMSLVMTGSMLLGQEAAPPAAYERTILSVKRLNVLELPGDDEDDASQVTALITLDAEVPASAGTIIGKLRDGRTVRFRYTKTAKKSPIDGERVKDFQATWNRKKEGFDIHDLNGISVRVYSDLFPPEASGVDTFQRRVIDGLRDIQAMQFMEGGLSL